MRIIDAHHRCTVFGARHRRAVFGAHLYTAYLTRFGWRYITGAGEVTSPRRRPRWMVGPNHPLKKGESQNGKQTAAPLRLVGKRCGPSAMGHPEYCCSVGRCLDIVASIGQALVEILVGAGVSFFTRHIYTLVQHYRDVKIWDSA